MLIRNFFVMDGSNVGWSTGNLSPSDFRDQTVYPVFGADGWAKQNRDYTLWIDGDANAADPFREVLWKDWYTAGAVDWSPNTNIHCG